MRPSDYPLSEQKLLAVWQSFQDNTLENEDVLIDPLVLESWKRCRTVQALIEANTPKLIPTTQLQDLLQSNDQLISTALPYLEDIHQLTEGTDSVVVLTNHQAQIISIEGDASRVGELFQHGLGLGSRWAEDTIGTNAIGLALITAMSIQVAGPEHYRQQHHAYVTTAAPIHDENGQIIGVIGLITGVKSASPHHLAVVMSTAKAISNQFQTELFLNQANERLFEVGTILETVTDGIVMWNAEGIVSHINKMAAQIWGINAHKLLGKKLINQIGFSSELQQAISDHRELVDFETNLKIQNRDISCFISIRPVISGEEVSGSVAIIRTAQEVRRLVTQQIGTQASLTFDNIQSHSPSMRNVLRQAQVAARGISPVIISGEDGVGKNALARAIHNASLRANQPFVIINCRAIPREIMLEELLGREGASTKPGQPSKFELADQGTLLFDHVQHLSLEAQAVLDHVIRNHEITRIGSSRTTTVDVRIIVTTSENIGTLVADKRFASQLYYLFRVFQLDIIPLRQRTDDILLLANNYLETLGKHRKRPFKIDEEVAKTLQRYPWPGNISELESVLERASASTEDNLIRVTDLPTEVRRRFAFQTTSPIPQPVISIAEAEREAIIRAGYAYRGVATEMANALGIDRSTLWRKMKQLNLSPDHFKNQ